MINTGSPQSITRGITRSRWMRLWSFYGSVKACEPFPALSPVVADTGHHSRHHVCGRKSFSLGGRTTPFHLKRTWERPMKKRTGRHVGAPTREERQAAYQTKLEDAHQPLYGPPVPPGLRKGPRTQWDRDEWKRLCRERAARGARMRGWGGARVGSGRPRREGNPNYKFILIRLEWGLAAKLEVLPEGTRSEYIRKAIDLMADLVAPEKFKLAATSPPFEPRRAGARALTNGTRDRRDTSF